MTVKVTKLGKLPGGTKYNGKCTYCKTEFSFEQRDAVSGIDRNQEFLQVFCPLCRQKVYIDVKK